MRRGELPSALWLAERIDAAVAPLAAVLDESTLAFVRATLEERVTTDPLLQDLVRRLIARDGARYDGGGRVS